MKTPKTYRLSEQTCNQLKEIKSNSTKTETEIIEEAVNRYYYELWVMPISGRTHQYFIQDEDMLQEKIKAALKDDAKIEVKRIKGQL